MIPAEYHMGRSVKYITLWFFCALALAAAEPINTGGIEKFDKTCNYTAYNVPVRLFFDGADFDYLFALETSHAALMYEQPWQACFGPSEVYDAEEVRQERKLPCAYTRNQWGNIDYWEEHACDVLVKTNCYCFALNRYVGSYCEPGLGGTNKSFPLPVRDCDAAVQGIVADGAVKVSREIVYNVRPTGHYIALAVKPSIYPGDTGDFHFWRLDADGAWAYKAGDTLSRRTYRNGTKVYDIERPEPRGAYVQWCGYFEVWPETHKLVGNNFWYSNVPRRFRAWAAAGLRVASRPLYKISAGWRAAYKDYFWDAGWEDFAPAVPKERARLPMLNPHWQSVRPMHQGA